MDNQAALDNFAGTYLTKDGSLRRKIIQDWHMATNIFGVAPSGYVLTSDGNGGSFWKHP
jgi:hypothetical protein